MVDLDELAWLISQAARGPHEFEGGIKEWNSHQSAVAISLRYAAEELIRDARRWREYEADMRRAISIEEEQS